MRAEFQQTQQTTTERGTFSRLAGYSVYVVHSAGAPNANKRVLNIVRLASNVGKLQVVSPRGPVVRPQDLVINPFPNPLALFRKLGLKAISAGLERYALFPSWWRLYAQKLPSRLNRLMREDMDTGLSPVLITCLPAHDLVLVGLACKKRLPSLRWIVDWQDLWSYDRNYYERSPKLYRRRLKQLEARTLAEADHHVTTNYRAAEVLRSIYCVPPRKVTSIMHPYDEDDQRVGAEFAARPASRLGSCIRVGFLGTLFKPPRVPGEEIVTALSAVRSRGIELELHVIGDAGAQRPGAVPSDLVGLLFMHPRIPHAESLAKIADCDILLLVLADLPNSRAVLSIKLPQYLLLGRPLLAIVPDDCVVADIVRATKAGIVVPPGEGLEYRLESALNKLIPTLARRRGIPVAPSWLSAQHLAERWAAVVDGDAPPTDCVPSEGGPLNCETSPELVLEPDRVAT